MLKIRKDRIPKPSFDQMGLTKNLPAGSPEAFLQLTVGNLFGREFEINWIDESENRTLEILNLILRSTQSDRG